jgi:hypothetical protein
MAENNTEDNISQGVVTAITKISEQVAKGIIDNSVNFGVFIINIGKENSFRNY